MSLIDISKWYKPHNRQLIKMDGIIPEMLEKSTKMELLQSLIERRIYSSCPKGNTLHPINYKLLILNLNLFSKYLSLEILLKTIL